MPRRVLAPLFILLMGIVAWYYLSRPVDKPKPVAMPPQAVKSEYVTLTPVDYQVQIMSQGVVRPQYLTTLTALVAGTVIKVNPTFEDGAFFEKDDVLIELDPKDFEAQLATAEARLARAEALLSQEVARAKQAKLNWQDIGYTDEPSDLVLRIPQLKEAEATVKSANADLEQARRNLERTKILAPFAGRVKLRKVGLGQSVTSNTQLGEVFNTDVAEVRLPISPTDAPLITLPTREGDKPVPVELTDALMPNSTATWQAEIIRTEGTLDETSRELFAIAKIHDPFGLKDKKTPLKMGQPVRAKIKGNILTKVFVIPRSALRGVNRISIIEGNPSTLERRDITPIWSTENEIVVRDNLTAGEKLSTSKLTYAPDGAPVQIIESKK